MSEHGQIEQRYLDCEITEDECFEFGKEQAKLIVEVRVLDADKKVITDLIKPKKLRVDELATVIDSGIENREVECVWEYDWDKGIKNLRRSDTDRIVGATMEIGEHEERPLL